MRRELLTLGDGSIVFPARASFIDAGDAPTIGCDLGLLCGELSR
jgi:hypothetical protein